MSPANRSNSPRLMTWRFDPPVHHTAGEARALRNSDHPSPRLFLALGVVLALIATVSPAGAADSDSAAFADAQFTGQVRFISARPERNGRFCNIARQLRRPTRQSLAIVGGLVGESSLLAYGTVNGKPGTGFYGASPRDGGIGFSLVVGGQDLTPRAGRAVRCGVSQSSLMVRRRSETRARITLDEYIGCEERAGAGGAPQFYVCFTRRYGGIADRDPGRAVEGQESLTSKRRASAVNPAPRLP